MTYAANWLTVWISVLFNLPVFLQRFT